MLLVPVLLFVILVAWGLKDDSLYWSEAGWYTGFCIVASAVMLLFRLPLIVLAVPFIICDIILILKLLGTNPSATRSEERRVGKECRL